MGLLAHSPKADIPAQLYAEHILNVRRDAADYAGRATRFFTGDGAHFVTTVDAAATYHDLGKLDDANQKVLGRKSRAPLPVRHEDAGTAELLRLSRREAAVLVAAHHAGLFSARAEQEKRRRSGVPPFRFPEVRADVDERLSEYVSRHAAAGCPGFAQLSGDGQLHRDGFTRRLALSCLVDADHGDTARHYRNEVRLPTPDPGWAARLAALDSYVRQLPRNSPARDELRDRVYRACSDTSLGPPIRACDAPVGSGKTTAVMAHLLRVAQEKHLRHIFVVLPYVNIIKQSVDVYRKALVLPGERPEDIVAEHDHQADFADVDLRQLASLWRAPIVVTTAVQFFETLGASHPARLRKLHELPGSAVFVDEAHAAIPSVLWPQVWRWLEIWTSEWGGQVVLASGSLPRFWELREFVEPAKLADEVPDILPQPLRTDLEVAERVRINPVRREEAFDRQGLIDFVLDKPGPRLLILNTVQSAAVLADQMQKQGRDVLHLSTALAPIHRGLVVDRLRERLRDTARPDWTLVATSCVESGMNFSFRSGFRESASTASLIQVGGRVSRETEYAHAVVWDFRVMDSLMADNPGLAVPRRVLGQLFESREVEHLPPSELAKEAMRREVTAGADQRSQKLKRAEDGLEYPTVSELCRVIDAQAVTVVVDPELVALLRARAAIDRRELVKRSVQIQSYKVKGGLLPIEPLFSHAKDRGELYAWTAEYDPQFLGYMAGVLPMLSALKEGVFIV